MQEGRLLPMAFLAVLRTLEQGLPSPDEALAKDLKEVLAFEGALDPRVLAAAGSDGPGELIALALPGASPGPELVARVGQLLAAAADAGRRVAEQRLREPAGLGDAEVVLRRQRQQREAEEAAASAGPSTSERPWTLRAGARLKVPRLGAGGSGLAERDLRLHRRWLKRFVDILVRSDTPAQREAQASTDPARMLEGLAGRARAATLRVRVRTWERMARWLETRRGRTWPTAAEEVLEYLWAVLEEAPKVSFPAQLRASLKWFEVRAGVAVGDRLSSNDFLARNFEKAELEVQASGAERRKAPRLPVVLLAALELLVGDAGAPGGLA